MIAFLKLGGYQIGLSTYFSLENRSDSKYLDHHHKAIPESFFQFQDNLLLVSSIDGLEIYDIMKGTSVRLISFNKSFQLMIRVNPRNYNFED